MIYSLPRPAWLRAATALYLGAFLLFLFVRWWWWPVFAFNNAPYPAPPWHGFTLDWFLGNQAAGRTGLFRDRSCLAASGPVSWFASWVTALSVLVGTRMPS